MKLPEHAGEPCLGSGDPTEDEQTSTVLDGHCPKVRAGTPRCLLPGSEFHALRLSAPTMQCFPCKKDKGAAASRSSCYLRPCSTTHPPALQHNKAGALRRRSKLSGPVAAVGQGTQRRQFTAQLDLSLQGQARAPTSVRHGSCRDRHVTRQVSFHNIQPQLQHLRVELGFCI